LLEGQLPSGLIPEEAIADRMTLTSWLHPRYELLRGKQLFTVLDGPMYLVNRTQRQLLLNYWQDIVSHTHQDYSEPYLLDALFQTIREVGR
jgi:hypothetical protein